MGACSDLSGLRKDGSEFPVEVSLSSAHDASLAIAFIADISTKKHLELERDRFFTLSPDLLCTVTPEGIFKQVNPAFQNCLGYSAMELVGKPYSDFVHPEDRITAEAVLGQLRVGGDVPPGYQNRYLAKDGSVRWLEWTARAVRDHEHVYAAGRDVTATTLLQRARKRDEERLRTLTAQLLTAQEEERRRIARELHDGPTQELALLAAELGLLQKKASDQFQNDQYQRELTALRERVQAIASDVRQLAHQYHPGVLEHAGLVAALEAHCQEVARHTGIPVRFVGVPDLGSIPMPITVSLYRIAQEALNNVAKHSGATAATVILSRVSLAEGKQAVRLVVLDEGKGFLIEQVRNGSGLGLISIEERARLVHGILRISSVPGEGTRVEVEVPIPEVEA
jgi:PAS domain S-box-containing protein